VFTDVLAQPLKGTSVTRRFQKALSVAGLPVIRFHHLRHLHAGHVLASGTDLAVVSKLLGHSSVALTASTYAGELPALNRAAAEQFEQYLSTGPDASRRNCDRRTMLRATCSGVSSCGARCSVGRRGGSLQCGHLDVAVLPLSWRSPPSR
jgi:hypothetical protein